MIELYTIEGYARILFFAVLSAILVKKIYTYVSAPDPKLSKKKLTNFFKNHLLVWSFLLLMLGNLLQTVFHCVASRGDFNVSYFPVREMDEQLFNFIYTVPFDFIFYLSLLLMLIGSIVSINNASSK